MSVRSAIPSATYRLQLHKDFTFADAQARLGYLAALGVSHLYLSPILAARAGSMHGYDVIDHGRINPELGGRDGFEALAQAARAAGLGVILDIVPNHMAVAGADNLFWMDVLEKGRASVFACMFDIDFDSPALQGKVLAPLLGEPYGEVLKCGQLSLIWDEALQKLVIAYGPHRLPIRPEDYSDIAGRADPAQADLSRWRNPDDLHALLERQNFRLAWWRTAGDLINWRRFFDVNELAGLRIEDEAVFERVHAITFDLYSRGLVDGVRIDHIDGLANPEVYLDRLKRRLDELTGQRPEDTPRDGPYVVIEKILGPAEALPEHWPVHGTTGYDFMNQVSAVQHDADGEAALNALWEDLSGQPADFTLEELSDRAEILRSAFAGQLAACARAFARLASADLASRDLGEEGFRRAITALIARLGVYRSYSTGRPHRLEPAIRAALDAARGAAESDAPSLDFIADGLAGKVTGGAEALRRLNQLTAPVAAKAVEDTAFYRYSRLLSRNDVGFDAARLAMPAEDFMTTGIACANQAPFAMLTTATHDQKRGEDVRARLAVLSEIPEAWRGVVTAWLGEVGDDRVHPSDAYSLFQTLVGAWPLDLSAQDADGLGAFADRVSAWRLKSLREAKLRSSWATPDTDYEALNEAWLRRLLDPRRSTAFLEGLGGFVGRIAPAGAINGLVQAAARCTWPGVPDLYQGCELWDLSLVDPDNRRPVDFDLRTRLLSEQSGDWGSGAVKQTLIAQLLDLRRRAPALFTSAALEPLPVRGSRTAHLLAFARRGDGQTLSVVAPLRVAGAVSRIGERPSSGWWADTEVQVRGGWSPAAALFEASPVFVEMSDHGAIETIAVGDRSSSPLSEVTGGE